MEEAWISTRRSIDGVSKATGWLAAALLVPLVLVVLYTVTLRTAGNAPDWGFEVAIFLYGTAIFISGGEVLRQNAHVSIDILPSLTKGTIRAALNVGILAVVITVVSVMVYAGTETAIHSTQIGERSSQQTTLNPPIWWFRWVSPVAGAFLILQACKLLVEEIIEWKARTTDG